jgi:DNA repair protein RadC
MALSLKLDDKTRLSELRARFMEYGLETLLPRERVELVLSAIDPSLATDEVAGHLLGRFGDLASAVNASVGDLSQVPGISDQVLLGLKLIREAGLLYTASEAERGKTSRQVAELVKQHWRAVFFGAKREAFEVAYLDPAGQLVQGGIQRIAEGTINKAVVYPRSVMESALRRGAASILIAHNHTNDDPRPSEQDKLLTRMLVLAGETIGVRVLDHLIFARDRVFSFAEEGLV